MGPSTFPGLRRRLLSIAWALLAIGAPAMAQTDAFVYRLPIRLRFADGRPASAQVVQVWQRQGEANGPQTDTQVAECVTGATGECVLEYQLAEYGDLPDLRIVGHTPAERIIGIGEVTSRWVLQGEEVLAGINGTPLALVLDVDAAGGFTRDLHPEGQPPVPVWDLMVPPAQTEAYAALATAQQTTNIPLQPVTASATVAPTVTTRAPSPLPPSPRPPTPQPTPVSTAAVPGSAPSAGSLVGVGLLVALAVGFFIVRRWLPAHPGNRS